MKIDTYDQVSDDPLSKQIRGLKEWYDEIQTKLLQVAKARRSGAGISQKYVVRLKRQRKLVRAEIRKLTIQNRNYRRLSK